MWTGHLPKWDGISDESNRQILETGAMKVTYGQKTDTLSVILREDVPVVESDEDKPGVILDYDSQRNLISIEVLDASRRVTEARKIEFQPTERQ